MSTHTNGAAGVRTHKVDLSLRDGTHADLIERASEEGSKGAAEHDVSVSACQPNAHAHNVLLCNEALHITVVEGGLVRERESGVLSVAI